MAGFGEREYWEATYRGYRSREDFNGFRYDWYVAYDDIKEILGVYLSKDKNDRIMHFGCGNSALAERLWKQGWTNITNVDFSHTVIADMTKQTKALHGIDHCCLDGRDLSYFPDSSFDVILEKGALDAVFCSTDSVEAACKVIDEFFRILRPGGCCISITCASAKCRTPYLQRPNLDWLVDSLKIPGGGFNYVANICRKTCQSQTIDPEAGKTNEN